MAATVMLVLPTATYRATAFLRAADRLGLRVVVASEEAPTLAALIPERMLTLDLGRPEQAAATAADFAARTAVDAVVGVDESAVLTAAGVAARLGRRHSPVEAVAATRDKRRLRARLAAAGVSQPRFVEIAADPEGGVPESAVAAVGFPCVVKPVDLAASRGVIRADDPVSLRAAVARVDALLRSPDLCGGEAAPLLLEAFVAGPEVAVEGLIDGGRLQVLAIFDKPDPLDGPYFEETLLITPSRHAAAAVDAVVATTARAVVALGLTDGPIHAELRLGGGGPVLIEVAARSIGGLCSGALRFVEADAPHSALSLEDLILRQALGMPLGRPRLDPPAAGALMLPILQAGTLRDVTGVDEARRVPGVVDVAISIPRGRPVVPLPEGDRYLGFVLARGDSPAAVETSLRRAGELVRADVAPPLGAAVSAPASE